MMKMNEKRSGGRVKRQKPPVSSLFEPGLTAKSVSANRLAAQLAAEIDENRHRKATSDIAVARILVVECLLANLAKLRSPGGLLRVPRNEQFYRTLRLSYAAVFAVTNALCLLGYLARYSPNGNGPVMTKYSATPKLTELLAQMSPEDFGHSASSV